MDKTQENSPPPTSSEAAASRRAWKHQVLDLEEVLEDSPMCRERMRRMEEDVDEFTNRLKKIVKTTRQIQAVSTNLSQLYKQFGDEMASFGKTIPDTQVQNGFDKFANSIKEIENFRELLSIQMENLISLPIDNFIKNEVEEVKERRRKYDKASSQYNSALSKLSGLKKKEINALRTMETEHELNDTKRDFRIGSLDFAFALNDIQAKKNFELLENCIAFTFAQQTYFHQGYELCNELNSSLRDLTTYTQKEKKSMQEERQQVIQHKKNLESQPTTSVLYIRDNSQAKSTAKTTQGYLFKKNTSGISSMRNEWQRRYFVVQDGVLTYYKTGKDVTPVASINLLLCSVKEKHDIDRRWCFELISPDKSFLLQAENDEKMREWINVLQNATADLLNSQSVKNLEPEAYNSSQDNNSGNTPAKLTALQQVRTVPSNNFCADCGAKDPEWASINLGILMCIECSGFHRSMGVHISKVRSFTLDKWEPEVLKFMLAVGNENANKIFEANLPPDVKKPTPNCDKVTREKWIRTKYQEKKFVRKPTVSSDVLNKQLSIASRDNTKVLNMLEMLAQGANINFPSEENEKRAPLHLASLDGHLLIVVLLIQHRADINAKDAHQRTPLHLAAEAGRTNISAVLFKNGAKLDLKDDKNQTPLDLAIATQQVHTVTLLRLAQLALAEANGNTNDASFTQALQNFSLDAEFEN